MISIKDDFQTQTLQSTLLTFDIKEAPKEEDKRSHTSSFYVKKERKAIGFAILAQFIWAVGVVLIRTGTKCNHFSPNSYSMWRSLFMSIVTYLSVKQKGLYLTPFSEVKRKAWFIVRTAGTYFCFLFYIIALLYLRTSTTSCLAAATPFVIIILSVWLLREAFYMRYFIGIIVCFLGSAMIVLNEKHGSSVSTEEKTEVSNIIIGLLFVSCHVVLCGLITFAQKLMVIDGLATEIQVFYTGFTNWILGIIFCFIEGNFGMNLWMIIVTFGNALVFYFGQMFTDLALRNMDVSKFSPTSYFQTLFVFLFSLMIFGEKFYFTDIVGSFLIVSFHLYNAYNPIRSSGSNK